MVTSQEVSAEVSKVDAARAETEGCNLVMERLGDTCESYQPNLAAIYTQLLTSEGVFCRSVDSGVGDRSILHVNKVPIEVAGDAYCHPPMEPAQRIVPVLFSRM